MAYKYIDVSRYQGAIDWQSVKNDGVDGVFLKTVSTNSSFGGLYIDPFFEKNYAECVRLGIPVGVYYYTYALDTDYADCELALLKQALKGKILQLPVAVDVEDNSLAKLPKQTLTELVSHALSTIESWGAYSILYTYTNFKNNYLDMAKLAPYDLWIADYTGNTPSGKYGIWQYTSSGSVAGISGRVDMNRAYKNYPAIIADKGMNNFTDAPSAPEHWLLRLLRHIVRFLRGE